MGVAKLYLKQYIGFKKCEKGVIIVHFHPNTSDFYSKTNYIFITQVYRFKGQLYECKRRQGACMIK